MLRFSFDGLHAGDEHPPTTPVSRRTLLRVEGLEDRLTPAFFTVNTTGDLPDANPNDGAALDKNGNTSLRAAIEEGNRQNGPHTIEFNLPAAEGDIIWLDSGLVLTKSYTIDGKGNFGIIGDDPIGVGTVVSVGDDPGGGAGFPEGVSIRRRLSHPQLPPQWSDNPFRLITVEAGAVGVVNSLTVRKLDLRYGVAVGNTVNVQSGGAIFSPQQLTVEMSSFVENFSQASGGAVHARGELSISTSSFTGNTALFTGGALYYGAPLGLAPQVVSGSVFRNNSAVEDGGAIYSGVYVEGKLPEILPPPTVFTLVDTTVEGNSAKRGGGIYAGGSIWVNRGSVSYNSSTGKGGGFFYSSTDGSALFSELQLDGNQAGTTENPEDGGGFYINFGNFTLDSPFSFSGNLGKNGTQGGAFNKTLGATFTPLGLPANADPVGAV